MSRIRPWRSRIRWISISSRPGGKTGFARKTPICANSTPEQGRMEIRRVEMTEENHGRSFVTRQAERIRRRGRIAVVSILVLALGAVLTLRLRADEPFARSRDYHLQNARI